mgnify:CR=1 FL=1
MSWTAHGGKHVAPKEAAWKDIVAGTRHGLEKYRLGTDIEALERSVWKTGTPVTTERTWKVAEFTDEIEASGGKSSRWVRVEESAGTIHGHLISEMEDRKLT